MKLDAYEKHGILNGTGGKRLTIWILADPHFLPSSLFKADSGAFREILDINNGKAMEVMPDVMTEFFSRALEEKPDLVLVPGDLTLNGELEGLRFLKKEFERLEAAGIRILVIPGNHDINCRYACDLNGDTRVPAAKVQKEDYEELMGSYGYQNGMSRPADSFSWIVPIADDIRILGFDTNTEQMPGGITEETLAWAEKQLFQAEEDGAAVITVTHHNVLPQNRKMTRGFVLSNHEAVRDFLKQHHVSLNLSGHVHLQHCSEDGEFCDITTESAAVFPLGYAVLEIPEDHRSWSYRRVYFDCGQELAKQRIEETAEKYLKKTLSEIDVSGEAREKMRRAGIAASTAVFAGWDFKPEDEDLKEGCELWKTTAGDTYWGGYIVSAIAKGHVKEQK